MDGAEKVMKGEKGRGEEAEGLVDEEGVVTKREKG